MALLEFVARLAAVKVGLEPLKALNADPYILMTDGAAKGNPGPAGAGAVIFAPDEAVVGSWSWYLGPLSNNAAEYGALILGLIVAKELGLKKLKVALDSELVARQLSGQYQVRHEGLRLYYQEAKKLLAEFDEVKVGHVYREKNGDADRLASLAAQNGAIGLLEVLERQD
ncbi:MAG: ribonuclease HI family protein [Deltaproteobacteria bacterium]|jgi:ribonuclease HI|nr:ribonuclease HI family protein [Deltaproteobacteria bacterium]